MFRSFVVLAVACSVAFCCDPFPNGTETKLNWSMCPESNTKVNSLKLTDKDGKEVYPVKLTEKLYVHLNVDNDADHENLRLDIEVSSWGGWAGCSWHKVPTFGLLNNLNACEHGVPCPIKKETKDITIEVDFSKYGKIISVLKDHAPYQILYKLTDRDSSKVTCTILQAHARTKA
ncbi:unnamed protein product [Bursaphelenchus okinawaensis]|uniref:MD-2-related lipid-recognition domain-containing protein n=1 Tax=Bursaphelenchus okinawaensis TaxID=465554 RepID=A0A811KM10_9BILA|nr:unnamed protein product [Bursaphelenchus okinawaensis]CAG9105020.1 unnamed protein product [Bursaphelenchus okinawaensis]